MDLLKDLSQPLTMELEVTHPVSGKGMGLFVTLLSKNHPELRDFTRKQLDSRVMRSRKGVRLSIEELEEEATELLVRAVKSWRGLTEGGEEVPCTPAKVRELMESPNFQWLRKQLDDAVSDDARFFLN